MEGEDAKKKHTSDQVLEAGPTLMKIPRGASQARIRGNLQIHEGKHDLRTRTKNYAS